MEQQNKNSLSYKIQKNPFLIAVGLIIAIIVLIAIFSLSSAIKSKTKAIKAAETTGPSFNTTAEQQTTTEPSNIVHSSGFKVNNTLVRSYEITYDEKGTYVTLTFLTKEALFEVNAANSSFNVGVVPSFYFYVNHGTQIMCPGTVTVSEANLTATYALTEINDLTNVVALTDEMTVTYENALTMSFNLYLEGDEDNKSYKPVTIAGSYAKTVEESVSENTPEYKPYTSAAKGIKNVDLTVTEKFVWMDVYFTDEAKYQSFNFSFLGGAVKMKRPGSEAEVLLNTTRYDDINMLRCKFDTYSLTQLVSETGEKGLTIPKLFSEDLQVFSTDYTDTVNWFVVSGNY